MNDDIFDEETNIFDFLDDSILDNLEKENNDYSKFYKESINQVNIFFIYTDKKNDIYHIKKLLYTIKNNVIPRINLIDIINTYKNYNNVKHKPISILQYNVSLSSDQIIDYLKNKNMFSFLDVKYKIDSIQWSDTISFFQELNSLYIVFNESHTKIKKKHNQTKKIVIHTKKKKKSRKHIS